MIIRDTYNGNEILRKYNKKGDIYIWDIPRQLSGAKKIFDRNI